VHPTHRRILTAEGRLLSCKALSFSLAPAPPCQTSVDIKLYIIKEKKEKKGGKWKARTIGTNFEFSALQLEQYSILLSSAGLDMCKQSC
jgi:hypothetical protein